MTSVPNPLPPLNGNKLSFVGLIGIALCLSACSASRRSIKSTVIQLGDSGKPTATQEKQLSNPQRSRENLHTVSLILPFDLSANPPASVSKRDMEQGKLAFNFYQGFKMALDSLATTGIAIQCHVFDSGEDSAKIAALTASDSLKNSEIIIGPVYPSSLKQMSAYAKRKEVYVVSPLSPQPLSAFNNPYLIMVNAPLEAYIQKMIDYIKVHYPGQKIIFLTNGVSHEEKFRKAFDEKFPDDIYEMSLNELKANAETAPSVLIVPTLDRAVWGKFMATLGNLAVNPYTVFAHPNFEKLNFYNYDLLETIKLHYASTYFVDPADPNASAWARQYKRRYFTAPDEYAVKGFDIGIYFGNLIAMGMNLSDGMKNYTLEGYHNRLYFEKDSNLGFRNTSVKIITFKNGQPVEDK